MHSYVHIKDIELYGNYISTLHIGEFINARVNENHLHVFADSRPQTPH